MHSSMVKQVTHNYIVVRGVCFLKRYTLITRMFELKEKAMKTKTILFELLVDGVPYEVRATPFQFNDDTRYRVSFNGGQIFVFVYDPELKRFAAIGEGTESIPD